MAARPNRKKTHLTEYEAEQVEGIAAWKSLPTNPLSELWSIVTLPAARLLGKLVPDPLVEKVLERADDGAAMLAAENDIKREAGIDDLAQLKRRPLEYCDRMALRTGRGAQILATAEGAATGAGGVFTTLADVPLLIVLALRTIRKIGHCYGFRLDGANGRAFVMGTLSAAMSNSLAMRRRRLQRLRDLEDLVIEETEQEIIVQEALSLLFQLEAFEEIPIVGAASGAFLNYTFMRKVDVTSRRVFQERWLREAGKARIIEPQDAPDHVLAEKFSGALGRAAYSGLYWAAFAAAAPAALIGTSIPLAGGIAKRLSRLSPASIAKDITPTSNGTPSSNGTTRKPRTLQRGLSGRRRRAATAG